MCARRARLTRVLEDYRVAIDAKADLEAETSTLRSRVGHLEGENKSLR